MASPLSLSMGLNAQGFKVGADEVKRGLKEITTEGAGAAKAVDRTGDSLDRAGKKGRTAQRDFRSVVTQLTGMTTASGYATTAIRQLAAGFGAYAVARRTVGTIAGFETSIAELRGVTGASGEALAVLSGAARQAGASTRYTAREAAQGLLELARAGLSVQQSAAALTPTLNLATAGILSLASAAELVTNVANQFGLPVEQFERIGDVLVAAANASNSSVADLGQGLKDVGVVANQVGISIEETAAALGVLANRGLKGSDGAIKLRQVFLQLLDPTAEAVQTLIDMDLSIADVDIRARGLDGVLRNLANAQLDVVEASRLVGVRNAAALVVLSQGVGEWDRMRERITGTTGDMKEQAAILDNTVTGSWKLLQSAVDEVILSVGDAGLAGALKNVIDLAREAVGWTDRFLDNLAFGNTQRAMAIQDAARREEYFNSQIDRGYGPQRAPAGYQPVPTGFDPNAVPLRTGTVGMNDVYSRTPRFTRGAGFGADYAEPIGPDVPMDPIGPPWDPSNQYYRAPVDAPMAEKANEASAAVRDLSAGLAELAATALTSAGDLRQAALSLARSLVMGYSRSAFQTGFQTLLGGTAAQTGAPTSGGSGGRVTPNTGAGGF